jgi:hypothetical protein
MRMRPIMAMGLAIAMGIAAIPIATIPIAAMPAAASHVNANGQPTVTLAGTAKKEAKKPYIEFSTRARNAQGGDIAGTTPLDTKGEFSLADLPPANYVVELLNKDGKVVCTEGPFDMTSVTAKNDIDISCNKVPAAWWLLGVAAAAGITAGVVVSTASASQ